MLIFVPLNVGCFSQIDVTRYQILSYILGLSGQALPDTGVDLHLCPATRNIQDERVSDLPGEFREIKFYLLLVVYWNTIFLMLFLRVINIMMLNYQL